MSFTCESKAWLSICNARVVGNGTEIMVVSRIGLTYLCCYFLNDEDFFILLA